MIPRRIIRSILERAPLDREVCGFLLGLFHGYLVEILDYREVRNISRDPHRFLMDPKGVFEAYSDARSRGVELAGIYHTHPGFPSIPSPRDLEGMELWPIPWLIIGLPEGDLGAWILCGSLKKLRITVNEG